MPRDQLYVVTNLANSGHGYVLLRWHIQLGNIVIPKSVHPSRIASNFDVFDFELSASQLASVSSLEDGTRLDPNPRTFNSTGR
ncbi:hypothetical protein A5791_15275 [Mycobacterium sp. 852002-51163_SCH5372311]|nr:hypothetical protein A5791_15275 [Mycobacterium sp. 852002-51163_SCH5372311]